MMNRKEFIRACSYACAAGLLPGVLITGCSSTIHVASSVLTGNKIAVNKNEFIIKGKSTYRNFITVNSERFSYPICIYRLDDNSYSALLLECTHNSCELQPQGNFLVCPCHGSEFNKMGEVQNPPAERSLQVFTTTTDNEKIYIHL
jgi:cytochrome b6-f complex iron-sulfur subunit